MEGGDTAELESEEVSLAGDTSVPSGFLDAEAWLDFPADTMLSVDDAYVKHRRLFPTAIGSVWRRYSLSTFAGRREIERLGKKI